MLGSKGRFGAAAMAVALLTAGYSRGADADTIRLGGAGSNDDAPAQSLLQRVGDDGEVIQTRGRGGFVAGGYRGGGGGRGFVAAGYRGGGGYRGGYYGGYRGGVRVGVGVGGYRGGYWGGYGYRGFYGGYGYRYPYWGYRGGVRIGVGVGGWGYGGYYGYPSYYSYGYYNPCVYGASDPVYTDNLSMQVPLSTRQVIPPIEDGSTLPAPQQNVVPQPNGPYRYDGGPVDPVPQPMKKPAPTVKQTPTTDRFVSMPAPPAAKKYSYAAYGEKRQPTGEKEIVMPGDDGKNLLVRMDAR